MADVALLRGVPFLSTLTDAQLESLATRAEDVPFAAGDEILEQGKPNDRLYVIASGTLHASRARAGDDIEFGRLGAGNFFGELSAFDPGPTTGGVRAITDGTMVRIRLAALDEFAKSNPTAGVEIYRRLLEQVAHRLRESDERASDLVTWGKLEPAD